uniref:Uncharacterized protein n=1 Tax=Anopheles maculatus TaxID=74869 RepID=A0A182SI10_9DIPT
MFSWRGFRITTKISYAIYLTQFPIFFYNVGRTRTPQFFEFWPAVIFNTNEYLVVFLSSFLLTVLFETPFINVKKMLFSRSGNAKLMTKAGDSLSTDESSSTAHRTTTPSTATSNTMVDENENSSRSKERLESKLNG